MVLTVTKRDCTLPLVFLRGCRPQNSGNLGKNHSVGETGNPGTMSSFVLASAVGKKAWYMV